MNCQHNILVVKNGPATMHVYTHAKSDSFSSSLPLSPLLLPLPFCFTLPVLIHLPSLLLCLSCNTLGGYSELLFPGHALVDADVERDEELV